MVLALYLSCLVFPAEASSESLSEIVDQAAQAERLLGGGTASGLLENQTVCPAGSNFCDWAAFAFAQTGQYEDYGVYLTALEHFVTQLYMQEQSNVNGRQRIALTVLALGGDPTAFGTASDGTSIDLVADSTYNYAGDFSQETTNVLVFALITLDAKDTVIPADGRYSREDILNELLSRQTPADGGFGLIAGSSDVDVTAMVIQALAAYRDDMAVGAAIERALSYLQEQMDEQGNFVAYGTDSAESLAQVILALCALGIDPDADGRFCAPDSCPSQALLQYRCDDGGFKHTLQEEKGDFIATQQAMLALEAIERVRTGQPGVYDLSAGANAVVSGGSAGFPIWIVVAAVIAVAAVIVVICLKKRGTTHV